MLHTVGNGNIHYYPETIHC